MPTYETSVIDGVSWIVQVMTDGRRQRIGREVVMERVVDTICAQPLWESPDHCKWFWKNEARLNRIERKAKEEERCIDFISQ